GEVFVGVLQLQLFLCLVDGEAPVNRLSDRGPEIGQIVPEGLNVSGVGYLTVAGHELSRLVIGDEFIERRNPLVDCGVDKIRQSFGPTQVARENNVGVGDIDYSVAPGMPRQSEELYLTMAKEQA